MRIKDTPLNRHVRRYLNNTGKTQAALEREAGLGRSTLNGVLNGKNHMSRVVFDALDPFVKWEPTHRAFIQQIAPRRSPLRKPKFVECDPKPWLSTVAELKARPPVYNWRVHCV